MLRVVLGRARPDTEWSGRLSGLQFDSASRVRKSARSRDATSMSLTVTKSHGEEVDLEANGKPRTELLNDGDGMDRTNEVKLRI
jgi:hypothetical protein